MNALLPLSLSRCAVRRVLLPGDVAHKPVGEGVEITVFGDNFPIRAIEPEILVGDHSAQRVAVAANRHSIRGYLRQMPAEGSTARVPYGDSQEGELRSAFRVGATLQLPTQC